MRPTRLNLEDLPDSDYALEMRRSNRRLRFSPPLEAEYAELHLQRVRLRVRVWFSLGVLLSVQFTSDQVQQTGVLAALLHIGAILPCSLVLAWLSWSRYYDRFYLRATRILLPISNGLISVFTAGAIAAGLFEPLAALTVVLIAVFFFTGLMFREAVLTSVIMLAAFAAAAAAVGLPQALFMKSMVILVLTGIIGSIAHWDMEKSYRMNFLEAAVIRELVSRDGLSGLMNRRAFDDHLLRAWQHALRDRRAMALLIIDIDHFKQYNDAAGHQAGDVALRSVARAIGGFARRPMDLAARYGGEEFAVILYDPTLQHVQETAERIRQMVEGLQIKPAGADRAVEPGLTISIGVGSFTPRIGRTPYGAIQLADEALYEAKEAGRNRVVLKGEDDYQLLDTGAFKSPSVGGHPR